MAAEHLSSDAVDGSQRELFDLVGESLELPDGKVELIFSGGRYVDAWLHRRLGPRTAEQQPALFCSCPDTTTVNGLCVGCGRPKRERKEEAG